MNLAVQPSETPPDSRLYTFIDGPREFALYFLEGQRLIQDLALLHPITGQGFAYFRDVVLSIQPMIALLKSGEQLGFYIDSAEPFFRLKIETGHHGATRCTLLPEEFREFPESLRGTVRLLKLFPRNPVPYESLIEGDALPLREIVNRILSESYQVNSAMIVSRRSDQSVLLHQLPPLRGNKDDYVLSQEAVEQRRVGIREAVGRIFGRSLSGTREIEESFAKIGFRLLANRVVRFKCSCSRARMLQHMVAMHQSDPTFLVMHHEDALSITCEYCKTCYHIPCDDVRGACTPLN